VIQVVVTVIITGQEAGVTSYIECSAREYSRTSIISDSDISPSNTENLSDAYVVRTWSCFSLQRSKQSGSYHCYSQAREETKPSFDPQFLQNSASAGLAVLQLSQIFGPCTGPVRGVSSGHGRTGFSIALPCRV